MNNYYRITAYHPDKDLSVIMDCCGMFEKKWQFSSYLVNKGFKILYIHGENEFLDGNIPKSEPVNNKLILRACKTGMPDCVGSNIELNGKFYLPGK